MQMLVRSKKAVHKLAGMGISYRSFAERTKRGRLGLVSRFNRTDKCSVCYAWDTVVCRELRQHS
eukprot:12502727-Prorocentrum_lima.AAC.1